MKHTFLYACMWFLVQGPHRSAGIRDADTRSLSSSFIQHETTYGDKQLTGEALPCLTSAARASRGDGKHGVGIPSNKAESLIADASPVLRKRFPYACSLRRDGSEEHVCGGVLVDERWVLTAAHCLWNKAKNGLGHNALVHCGIDAIDTDDPASFYRSTRAYWPREWDGDFEHGYDVGLVRLDRRLPLERPRVDRTGHRLRTNDLLIAAVWGSQEENSTASAPQSAAKFPFLSVSPCEEKFETRLEDSVICAESVGRNSCRGDSGWPLLIPHVPKGDIAQGSPHRDLLIGISSPCPDARHAESLSIYTRVSAFWEWIDQTIRTETEISGCLNGKKKEDLAASHERNEKTLRGRRRWDVMRSVRKEESWKDRDAIDDGLLPSATSDDDLRQKSLLRGSSMLHRTTVFDAVDSIESHTNSETNDVAVDKQGKSPLHVQTERLDDALEAAEALLDHGGDINVADVDGGYPLHLAARQGHLQIMKLLISAGADINARAANRDTPLHEAVANRHDAVVEMLLLRGADVNAVGENGWTALHHAARAGLLEIAAALLNHEAKVDIASYDGWTPLHYATRYGFEYLTKEFLKYGADANAANGESWTPLHMASRYGHSQIVRVLLDKGVDVSVGNGKGWTALHIASRRGYVEIVQQLLDNGAAVDAVNDEEWTALHEASRHGHDDIVRILLDHGAEVNAVDNKGWNALHKASRHGHNEIVTDLIVHQADVFSTNGKGWTALHMASRHGHTKSVRNLLDHGADVQAVEEDGWTPLHLASHAGHFRIAKDLVVFGAFKESRTKTGENPLGLVCTTSHCHCSSEIHSALEELLTP